MLKSYDPLRVKEVGTVLPHSYVQPSTTGDICLVLVVDTPRHSEAFAYDVTCPHTYSEMLQAYRAGVYPEVTLYRLSREDALNCR